MADHREISYVDELLADGSVHRSYADGRHEWRTRAGDSVQWRDDRGRTGVDEPLGRRLVKRTTADGTVLYGREGGFGRTLWGDGVLTVNRTQFRGRTGALLAAGAGLLGVAAIAAPPLFLSPVEEEELRRQALTSAGSGTGADSGSGADVHQPDWSDDDSGDGDGGDFG